MTRKKRRALRVPVDDVPRRRVASVTDLAAEEDADTPSETAGLSSVEIEVEDAVSEPADPLLSSSVPAVAGAATIPVTSPPQVTVPPSDADSMLPARRSGRPSIPVPRPSGVPGVRLSVPGSPSARPSSPSVPRPSIPLVAKTPTDSDLEKRPSAPLVVSGQSLEVVVEDEPSADPDTTSRMPAMDQEALEEASRLSIEALALPEPVDLVGPPVVAASAPRISVPSPQVLRSRVKRSDTAIDMPAVKRQSDALDASTDDDEPVNEATTTAETEAVEFEGSAKTTPVEPMRPIEIKPIRPMGMVRVSSTPPDSSAPEPTMEIELPDISAASAVRDPDLDDEALHDDLDDEPLISSAELDSVDQEAIAQADADDRDLAVPDDRDLALPDDPTGPQDALSVDELKSGEIAVELDDSAEILLEPAIDGVDDHEEDAEPLELLATSSRDDIELEIELDEEDEPALADAPPPPARPAAPAAAPAAPAAPVSPVSPAAPAAPAAQAQPRRRAWWEVFFSDDYLRTVPPPSEKQIARECDFIMASLGLPPGSTVLDVGCGLGLHAIELAKRGLSVVGLDLSLPMLSRAADEAQAEGVRINFLHGDLREMTFDGAFDGVLCWGTTFGYFDDETNREVVSRLFRALRPKGRLLLDVINRDLTLSAQPNLVWFEGDGCVCMEETRFNYFSSRLEVKRTVIMNDDGRQRENVYTIRLYSLHELGQMLHSRGFRVASVSGQIETPKIFFGQTSQQMIVLAERRTGFVDEHLPPAAAATPGAPTAGGAPPAPPAGKAPSAPPRVSAPGAPAPPAAAPPTAAPPTPTAPTAPTAPDEPEPAPE